MRRTHGLGIFGIFALVCTSAVALPKLPTGSSLENGDSPLGRPEIKISMVVEIDGRQSAESQMELRIGETRTMSKAESGIPDRFVEVTPTRTNGDKIFLRLRLGKQGEGGKKIFLAESKLMIQSGTLSEFSETATEGHFKKLKISVVPAFLH